MKRASDVAVRWRTHFANAFYFSEREKEREWEKVREEGILQWIWRICEEIKPGRVLFDLLSLLTHFLEFQSWPFWPIRHLFIRRRRRRRPGVFALSKQSSKQGGARHKGPIEPPPVFQSHFLTLLSLCLSIYCIHPHITTYGWCTVVVVVVVGFPLRLLRLFK